MQKEWVIGISIGLVFVFSVIVFGHVSGVENTTGQFSFFYSCSGGPEKQGTCREGYICSAEIKGKCKTKTSNSNVKWAVNYLRPLKPLKLLYGLNSLGNMNADELFTKGDKEEIAIGTKLNDSNEFGNNLQNNHVSGLLDISLTINNNRYPFHEEVFFNGASINGSSLETGLTFDRSEEWKENVFVQIPAQSLGYRFKFDALSMNSIDSSLKPEDYLTRASESNPILIPLLGKSLEVTEATSNSLTFYAGQRYLLKMEGSVSVDINGVAYILKLRGTSGNKVDVQVGNTREVIAEGAAKTFTLSNTGKMRVRVEKAIDEDGIANDIAVLIIGNGEKNSYHNGDAYINENRENPVWIWKLNNLNSNNPTIEVKNAFGIDSWREIENSLVKHPLYSGDYFCFPNNYLCLVFEKMTQEDNEFGQYVIESDTVDLSDEDNDPNKRIGVKVLRISSSENSGFGLAAAGTNTDTVVMAINETSLIFARKEQDGSEYINFAVYPIRKSSTMKNTVFYLSYKSTFVPVNFIWEASRTIPGRIMLDFGKVDPDLHPNDGDIIIRVRNDTATTINYLGDSDSDISTAYDITYNHMGTLYDISGKEENLRTKHGVIIYDPRLNAKADRFKFSLPPKIDNYRALLRAAIPKEPISNACIPENMRCIQKTNGEFNWMQQICCGDNSQHDYSEVCFQSDYATWKDLRSTSSC